MAILALLSFSNRIAVGGNLIGDLMSQNFVRRMKLRHLGGRAFLGVGVGTMPLSVQGRPSRKQAVDLLCRAVDLGIQLFDTADVYCLDEGELGYGERLIATARRASRAFAMQSFVATKGGYIRRGSGWGVDGSPAAVTAACEASLKRLNVASVALYQLHCPDPRVPLSESCGALSKLVDQGKAESVGVSNVTLSQLQIARKVLGDRLVSVQNRHLPGSDSKAVLEYCAHNQLAFLSWSPLGGIRGSRRLGDLYPVLRKVGESHSLTPHQVVVAWNLCLPNPVIPLVGMRKIERLDDLIGAASTWLNDEEVQEIEHELRGGGT